MESVINKKRGSAGPPYFVSTLGHDAPPEMVVDESNRKKCGRQDCAEAPTHGRGLGFDRAAKLCALHALDGMVDVTSIDPAHAWDDMVDLTSDHPAHDAWVGAVEHASGDPPSPSGAASTSPMQEEFDAGVGGDGGSLKVKSEWGDNVAREGGGEERHRAASEAVCCVAGVGAFKGLIKKRRGRWRDMD